MAKKKTLLIVITTIVILSIVLVMIYINGTSIKRPQEPSQPYPYYSEEITFQNTKANISLAGTLTLPTKEGNFPAAILVTGSGPQNRDEEVSGHKPFLIIADYLTRNGIAVLRYDDRGFGKSTGDFETAFVEDFATDVNSAIDYLNTRVEIDKNKIGLIGHSEGGIVAPMAAFSRDDVSFIVLLASPGVKGANIILKQVELISRSLNVSESDIQKVVANNEAYIKMVTTSKNRDTLMKNMAELLERSYNELPPVLNPENFTEEEFIAEGLEMALSERSKKLLQFDPSFFLQKITCPVLALNGDKDVLISSEENLAGIYDALIKGGNTDVRIKEIPNLNHFFQECNACTLEEHETIEQTFSPVALKEISDWILEKVK